MRTQVVWSSWASFGHFLGTSKIAFCMVNNGWPAWLRRPFSSSLLILALGGQNGHFFAPAPFLWRLMGASEQALRESLVHVLGALSGLLGIS